MVRFLRKSLHIQVFPIDDVDDSTESIPTVEVFSQFLKGPDNLCYADYTVSASGLLYGRPVTFKEIAFQCAQLKMQLELKSLATVMSVLEPYNGLGLILSVFLPVYCGIEVNFFPRDFSFLPN
jgi:acyl-CoA synthetase (AMP-forming)/AMP-acid ligase II